MQALRSNGVVQYDPVGELFDPNLHNALFQMPDPTKKPGTVAVVSKVANPLNLLPDLCFATSAVPRPLL